MFGLGYDPYYDRAGLRITEKEAEILWYTDYRFVLTSRIRGYLVSTIWMGIDFLSLGEAEPGRIFETLVFDRAKHRRRWTALYDRHYATEAEARKGHSDICRMIRSGWRGRRTHGYDD